MSLREDITEKLNVSDSELYDSVREVLRQYKSKNVKHLRYDFETALLNGNANRLEKGLSTFRTQNNLSYDLSIKGLTRQAIYRKMRLYDVNGFNPKNEDKKITKAICKLLFIKRETLVVKR